MKRKNGFEIIDAMIMTAIIGIVAAVIIPRVTGFFRISTVYIDGKQVFEGRTYCLDVKSAGAATEIDIGRGPMCLFPGDHYVNRNVKVETH